MSNYNFAPTLDGLNNVDGNSINSNTVITDYLTVNLGSSVPTLAPSTNNNSIASTAYVDTAITAVGAVSLAGTNVFTGFNIFNTNLPTSNITANLPDELVNKNTLDNEIAALSGSYVTLAGTPQTITGGKTFNGSVDFLSFLPTSTITATYGNELINKDTLDTAISTATSNLLSSANTWTGNTNTFNSYLPTSTISATSANQFVNKTTLDNAISTAGGSYVTLAGTPQIITGDKTFNGSVDFLSLEASLISNTGSIDTPNIGSGLASDPISIVPSQSTGTCNIATFATRTGAINIGTGTSAKTMTIGGTGTTTNINSLTTTISTSTTAGNGITHSSTTTTGDDMRLTATGGYLARIGEGSSSAGLTLLGIDAGTSIIKATTSALEIRSDAGLTFTGTIGSNNTYSGTNTLTGTTSFQNNVTVQAGNTVRYGSFASGGSGVDLGQTNTNEVTLKLVTTLDDFIFRTSGGSNLMTFDNFNITASMPFYMLNNFLINQSAYTSMGTTQLGYTIQKTFTTTALGDTTGTYTLVGSGQALGTNTGVYLITCGFELTNSGSDTVNNKALCLSLSSASGTPVNAYGAWEYYEEINDSMGSAGTRYQGTLTGVYTKTTTSAQSLFLNGYANTSGSQTISATGYCSITRIG